LIDINHQVIAEHDNFILAGSQNSQTHGGYSHGGLPPSLSHGMPNMGNMGSGDYENCVSALR
jgi:hypothetical protein